MARTKKKLTASAKKRLKKRIALGLYQELKEKGVKNPHQFAKALRTEIEERCPEYYAATTQQERQDVLDRYKIEDEALGLVC